MSTAGIPTAPARALGRAALGAGLLIAFVLLALGWRATRPAAPPMPDAQAAPRLAPMLRHVAVLGAAPRPIATAANAAARAYIVGQLRGIGLAPQVQTATVQKSSIRHWGGTHVTLGVVHNIVVRLPGSAPDRLRRPALLIAAHYDSGTLTPGAAASNSGAAQVAALIETARALHTGSAHLNDIVLLFADGEDVGALGASGFVRQHPLAREVGLILKFDGASGAGPLVLADASGAGSQVLRGWAAATPGMPGSALMARLYRLLPDMPRTGPLADIDAPALLFANTGRRLATERPDPALLAQMGDSMLRLAQQFGNAPLARGARQPHAWFTLPMLGQVRHPAILSWGLAALAALLLARGYHTMLARSAAGAVPLLRGFFGVAMLLLATRMLLWERRHELAALTRDQDGGAALVFALAGACLFIGALYLLRRLAGAASVFLGTMAWLAMALLGVLALAPDAAYLLAWPLVAALGAFTALQTRRDTTSRFLILALGLAPALLLLVPALRASWNALAPHGIYLPALVLTVMLLCFASLLLLLPFGRVVGAALLLATALAPGLAAPGRAAGTPAMQAEYPARAPERLVYFKDMNSWRAYWLLRDERQGRSLDRWTKGLFPKLDKPEVHVDVFGWNSPRQWLAIAPREDTIAYPEAFMLKNPRLARPGQRPALRQVEFTLRSKNRAPHIEMWAAGTKPQRSTLNGHLLTTRESPWSLSLYGMQDRLLRFTLDAPADDILAVVVEERMPGLPVHLLPPGAPHRLAGTGMTVSSDVLRFY
ncbi:M28 family peptidase [Massilia sp. MS-15]|uniref:M28 family peptidase n=1 Tax=Massilia sp. MS-15 TaxID=2878200 RepID=UPI001CD64030|nr:M28 family peptidase [Massilia sp. MS-15]MCA1245639.1 M28 family peptidase [Massilia sp. MS-15]